MDTTSSRNFFLNYNIHITTRILVVALLLYIALITCWIGDDARITFRSILNFLNGAGITFNYGERVQVFTHPVWFFVLSGFISITKELFYTTSIVSIAISIFSIIFLLMIEFNTAKSKLIYVSPIFLLAFSFAFADYMTSGLENPLSYLLTSLIFYLLYQKNLQKKLPIIFFLLALLVLNRFDFVLLFSPLALLLLFTSIKKGDFIRVIWIGTLIIVSWLIFSTIYFGTPLPNTFYAKLNAGFPQSEIFIRGIRFFGSLLYDFNSFIILCCGFLSIILYRDRFIFAFLIGKILYLCYILYAGGDFMQGRFFSILIFISICEFIVSINKSTISLKFKNNLMIILLGLVFCVSIFVDAPIYSSTNYKTRPVYKGVIDERGGYYSATGLFSAKRTQMPIANIQKENVLDNYQISCGGMGQISLYEVSVLHIDSCGLADPYLSRIPAIRAEHW